MIITLSVSGEYYNHQ